MIIIEIAPLENGAHRNQTCKLETIPEGWAVVPDDLSTENFPFGEVAVEEINGVPTVTNWVPVTIPEPEPVEPEPSTEEILLEISADHEARLCEIELGV